MFCLKVLVVDITSNSIYSIVTYETIQNGGTMEHMLIPPDGQMRNYSGHYLSLSQKLECDIWDHSTWRLKGTSEDFPWRSNAELLWAIFLSLSVKSLKRFQESCNNICQLLHSLKGASLLSHLYSSQKGKNNYVVF